MEQITQLTRLGLFDSRVPRYTSYPPAPHFTPAVGAGQVAEWQAAIPPGAAISLYVHVPFCRRLCWFCACRTQGTQADAPVRAYVATLLEEIAQLGARLAPGIRLSRLHWGGGTPTLLAPDLIGTLAGALLDAFPLAEGAEFSVEIDPVEVDGARMDALAAAGMARASIGVQDFDPAIQKTIGREQSYEVTAAAIEGLRARGIGGVNADILFGLPHQTQESIALSVQKLLSLTPDRVALYGYAHVPWMAKRQVMIPEDALPGATDRLALFRTAEALFLADGYEAIGIDHFARPGDGLARARAAGRLRRNFQGYTDDTAEVLVGLGASAISRYPQGYAQNAPATAAHVAAIESGRLSTARGHVFTAEDHWRGRMIEALMCDFRIDAAEMRDRFGMDAAAFAATLAPVAERFGAMVRLDAEGLAIRPEGEPLTRMIAAMLDAYAINRAGHSPAI